MDTHYSTAEATSVPVPKINILYYIVDVSSNSKFTL